MKALLFLALSVSISILAAGPLDTWTNVSPPGETNGFTTVTFGQGKFIAGARNGKLYSSTDGANWTAVPNPNTKDFAHLIFFRNRFFATTAFGSSSTALYDSPNGVDWTFRAQYIDGFGPWDTVLFWKGKYYVAGYSRSATSSDLTTWTILPSGTDESNAETNAVGSTAVGNENVYVWWSPGLPNRAVTGNSVTTLNSIYQLPVVYLEPNFLARSVSDGKVVRSTDGLNWAPLPGNLPADGSFLRSLIQANDTFILDVVDKVYSSTDFTNWTAHVAPNSAGRTAMAAGNSTVVRIAENGFIYRSGAFGNAAPVFLNHPEHVTVQAQKPFSLTVTVSGSPPINLQWRKNGENIGGANGLTYTVPAANVNDSGDYDVVATNPFGSATSHVANVLVDFFGIKNYAGLVLKGNVGQRFRIEYRPDIGSPAWTTLTDVTLTVTNQVWIDYESPENPGRFYRSVLVQ
jgi:hypothetical protein